MVQGTFRVLLVLMAVFSSLAAFAGAPPAPAAASHGESLDEARKQVDGITSRVIDDLWVTTDVYWHEGDYQRIIALLRVCVSADPTFVEAYSNAAWLLWSMGDTPGADAFLADGEARSPRHGEIAYEFGWHLFNTKRYAAAVPYLKRSIAAGGPVLAYSTLGHAYMKLKRYDQAVDAWQAVVTKFPNWPPGPHNLAEAKAAQKAAGGSARG